MLPANNFATFRLYRREGCTTAAFDRAAMNNHVDVIKWLMKHRSEGGTESALQWAVSRGYTEVGEGGAEAILNTLRDRSSIHAPPTPRGYRKIFRWHTCGRLEAH